LGTTAYCPFSPIPFSTADISIQLLVDTPAYVVDTGQTRMRGPQELIFSGVDESVFSDFLHVSVTIALTFAMGEVSIESSRLRRTILIQSLLSFIFYTMIFSVVANLLISNS
jgi:uncharacterized membrane protein